MSKVKIAIGLMGAMCLSGCTGLFGGKQARVSAPASIDVAEVYHDYAVEQLEAGRQLIANGAYATALQPLRKAAVDQKTAPAAYNAIAVAYAKMGRDDVASRFFSLAAILDPENPKIVANFRKFKEELALKARDDEASANANVNEEALAMATDARRPATVPAAEPVRTVTPAYGSRLSVSTRNEVMSRVSTREVMVSRNNSKPSHERHTTVAAQYPVKIKLGPATTTLPVSNYPVRVKLSPAAD